MNKENKNLGFSHILLQGSIIWLMGGMIFWVTEFMFILIGLLRSKDYQVLSNSMSVLGAINLTLQPGKLCMAFFIYILISFFGSLICTFIIYFIFRKSSEGKVNALIISIFLAFSFFIFCGFWLNLIYLPGSIGFKSILINLIFCLVTIILTYLCFKLFTAKSDEAFLPIFIALAVAIDFFMFGELFLSKKYSAGILSVKGIALSIGLTLISFGLFYVAKLIFVVRPFNTFSLYTVKKWVFSIAVILMLFSGIIIIMKEGWVKDVFPKEKTSPHNKPNIVLIVMDAARPDHLSCYGYKRKTSPNIDKIADEGVLFKNVISPSGWTVPSHASIFTGLFPFEHGVRGISPFLPEKLETMTKILQKGGYHTLIYSNNPWVGFFSGYSRGCDDFQEGWRVWRKRYFYENVYNKLLELIKRNDPNWLINDKGAAKTNQYVSGWIGKNLESPFFVFINYMETHLPYSPSSRNSIYVPKNIAPEDIKRTLRIARGVTVLKRNRSQEELSVINAFYDGEIHYLDKRIGELYETLRKLNILDDTLFIVTSDHGEYLGDYGILGHGFGLFNTLLEVPLIIRHPKYFNPGLIIENNVQTTDIFYTVLDAVDINYNPSNLGLGRSLIKRIKEHDYEEIMIAERDKPKDALYRAKNLGIDANHINKEQRAIIFNGYKYIQTSLGEEELYDLKRDPLESHNLVSKKKEVAAALGKRLQEIYKTDQSRAEGGKKIQMDKETESKLRSLGYIK